MICVDAWRVAGLSIKESFLKADRKYEIVDHLGNVRVVIANQRIPVDANGDSLVDYYKPLVKEISDYYPYGWVKFYGNYEFGANSGSLFEDWDSTKGTYYTLYRLLDARIARWYQVEPKIESYGTWSGYSYVFNNPVKSVDVLGLDTIFGDANARGDFNAVYNIVSNELEARKKVLDDLMEEWRKKHHKWGEKRLERWKRKVAKANQAYSDILQFKQVLDDIINSSVKFYIFSDTTRGGGTRIVSNDSVVIRYGQGWYTSLMHELRHGVGYLWGELDNRGAYDFEDERIAYRFEWYFFNVLLFPRKVGKMYVMYFNQKENNPVKNENVAKRWNFDSFIEILYGSYLDDKPAGYSNIEWLIQKQYSEISYIVKTWRQICSKSTQ